MPYILGTVFEKKNASRLYTENIFSFSTMDEECPSWLIEREKAHSINSKALNLNSWCVGGGGCMGGKGMAWVGHCLASPFLKSLMS